MLWQSIRLPSPSKLLKSIHNPLWVGQAQDVRSADVLPSTEIEQAPLAAAPVAAAAPTAVTLAPAGTLSAATAAPVATAVPASTAAPAVTAAAAATAAPAATAQKSGSSGSGAMDVLVDVLTLLVLVAVLCGCLYAFWIYASSSKQVPRAQGRIATEAELLDSQDSMFWKAAKERQELNPSRRSKIVKKAESFDEDSADDTGMTKTASLQSHSTYRARRNSAEKKDLEASSALLVNARTPSGPSRSPRPRYAEKKSDEKKPTNPEQKPSSPASPTNWSQAKEEAATSSISEAEGGVKSPTAKTSTAAAVKDLAQRRLTRLKSQKSLSSIESTHEEVARSSASPFPADNNSPTVKADTGSSGRDRR